MSHKSNCERWIESNWGEWKKSNDAGGAHVGGILSFKTGLWCLNCTQGVYTIGIFAGGVVIVDNMFASRKDSMYKGRKNGGLLGAS